MSTNYTNITLYGPNQDEVRAWCVEHGVSGYVSPMQDNITVLYENTLGEHADHPKPLEPLLARGAALSAALMCPALVNVVADDNMYMYVLYLDGQMRDNYMSYTDKPPANGNPAVLADLFDAQDDVKRIRAAMRRESVLSATERHKELMDALGVPPMMIDMGFDYLEEGEKPHGVEDNNDVIYVDGDTE